jgi:hypothetical protein
MGKSRPSPNLLQLDVMRFAGRPAMKLIPQKRELIEAGTASINHHPGIAVIVPA